MNATISGVSSGFHAWWQQREPRERAMLAIMCAAIAAFALWYVVFVPLRHARDAAQVRHVRAVADLAQVQAELAGMVELRERLPAPPTDTAALAAAVLASAKQAGLEIAHRREDDVGGFGIESEAATPTQLFTWLDELRQRHGLVPTALSVARNQDRLRVQARFEPQSP